MVQDVSIQASAHVKTLALIHSFVPSDRTTTTIFSQEEELRSDHTTTTIISEEEELRSDRTTTTIVSEEEEF